MMHTINVTTSRMPPLAGTTSPCNEAGEPKNRFQTFRLGHYAVRTEQSSRNSGRAAARSRKKGKTQVRERKRRAKDMRSKKKKEGQEREKRGSPGGEKGGKNPGKCLQHPSGTVPRSEWASPQPSPSDSRRVSAFFFFLIKTSRFIIQLINQEVLMSIQQLMISVKMKLEIHYISAQGNFPMYSKTYTVVFVLIWFLNNNSLCSIHHLVSL